MTLRCLTSFAFFRNEDMAALTADLRRDYGGRVEIFADSGAFSVATTGATVNLADYAAWLSDWRGVVTTAATLDVIGDYEATARNTGALLDAGLDVLPTFHVGTPWPVLEDLCGRHRYLALGGMVPFTTTRLDALMRWLVRCFKVAREHGTVFHGFGQTSTAPVSALPFYSVDSSTWITGAKYGRITLWDDQACRIVTARAGVPAEAAGNFALLRAHGADPAVVGRPGFAHQNHRSRADWAREYDLMRAISITAFARLGEWLARRHKVPAPPGRAGPGTCLFLAYKDGEQMRLAARTLAALREAVA